MSRTAALILVVGLLIFAPSALAHPGHGTQNVQLPPPTAEPEDGSSVLIPILVLVGLVGLGVAAGAWKQLDQQKAREGQG